MSNPLVDMEKPVKVICNGVAHEASLERRLKTMLDLAYASRDPGRVYTNFMEYDMPVVDAPSESDSE